MSAPADAADATGAYAWPGGSRLAAALPGLVDCRGLRVCDLGCGQGALARAALAGGAAEVLCLDGAAAALAAARAALAAPAQAAAALAGQLRFALNRWGEPLEVAPVDLVLGGDILYRPECHAQLLRSVRALLAEHGQALLSDPRSRLEEELPDLARAAGLSWECAREAGFTLVRLRRSPPARSADHPPSQASATLPIGPGWAY